MDYRGLKIRKHDYSTGVWYSAIRPRTGSNFGETVVMDPHPVGILRKVDAYIDAGGEVTPLARAA